ncbi:hypothetical protein IW140_003789 [Coemansia sp. RSA 1813]|nr:hypothetical protein EV178_003497 [Coemansia sp. RSA 1646]KAJ1766668.1 hypothetical protein LPJ74_005767 [Coemansia sp. RSA 1843]KAJ2088682.1 hypothetical protein IW138_004064 [Coemansia sp. RSA 986]KAJ2213113.1 hypothetical protein EV179_004083 [Coemansia sp. RSA 487]KAJ2568583.1 hypothetical protein IW140_003789 [Coemansia sp. RSA 1813]
MYLSGYSPKPRAIIALCVLFIVGFLVKIHSEDLPSADAINVPEIYSDAFNKTLGFHRIFVTHSPEDKNRCQRNIEAIAKLVDLDIEFVETVTPAKASQLRIQSKYKADDESVAELLTHKKIYAEIEQNNFGSALVLRCGVDVETDLKMRLASALGSGIADEYDILFVGRTDSEPTEPMVDELKHALDQLERAAPLPEYAIQTQLTRFWIKKEFLQRNTVSYRSTFPKGTTHAYALSGRMARRLNRRLMQRMASEAHDLDFILADIAMVGLSMAYSVSPPPIAIYGPELENPSQFLRNSVLHSIYMRKDDPSIYSPYSDIAKEWRQR